MSIHALDPRWRGALGFGLGGLATLLPAVLAWLDLPPWGTTLGGFGLSLAMIVSAAAFGVCGMLGAWGLGLGRLMTTVWTGIFVAVLPLQWGLTRLLAPAFLDDYPSWIAWTLVAIPQIFALGIVGTAAGFVAEGRPLATWGGRAMALSGGILYLTFLFNSWIESPVTGSWLLLVVERLAAFGAGGWLFGYGLERTERERRESALAKAVRRS